MQKLLLAERGRSDIRAVWMRRYYGRYAPGDHASLYKTVTPVYRLRIQNARYTVYKLASVILGATMQLE